MDFLVSVRPGRGVVRVGVPVELDIRDYLRVHGDEFLPLLAIELEDLGLDVRQVRVGTLGGRGAVERYLRLLDYLNTEVMVASMGVSDNEGVVDVLDEASMYGVRVIWEFGRKSLNNVDRVFEISREVEPHRLNIALHVARERSLRDFLRNFILMSGYVKVIYYSNKRGGNFGLPVFDGIIDYLKLTKILQMLKYDESLVLSYSPEYAQRYNEDLEALSTFINSPGDVDKRLSKALENLMNKIMSEQSLT
ncbi:hypothetical protein [Vulcanisaeta thermophila]|uniref:hypothetical protein n=1 Tax=Vulcanisaeta thermophila TaxID=867917 RepID=UPI000852CE39|nr:hypothetical protein [Vulcanisaeta thermophila]